jgi:cell division protein FtsB
VVRPPLRQRLIARLASVDLRPRTLAAKVPFVVLIIGALGFGLGITLWLSTDAAERSYQLGTIRQENKALLQQKEALERDVRQTQSAPALAEAARNLGMVPAKDTAHLIQDPAGNWVVVGSPKPADGVPLPPLNTKLPEEQPSTPQRTKAHPAEVPIRVPPGSAAGSPSLLPAPAAPGSEVLRRTPDQAATPGFSLLPEPATAMPGGPVPEPAVDGPVPVVSPQTEDGAQ